MYTYVLPFVKYADIYYLHTNEKRARLNNGYIMQ